MSLLRVANINSPMAKLYELLPGLAAVEYSQNNPVDNIAKLRGGEVDVALIPLIQYLLGGEFVGLDFGIEIVGSSNGLKLWAETDDGVWCTERDVLPDFLIDPKLALVPYIWAARPGVLSLAQYQLLDRAFHRIAKVGSPGVWQDARVMEELPPVKYYLNEDSMAGLGCFLRLLKEKGLLSDPTFCRAMATIFGRRVRENRVELIKETKPEAQSYWSDLNSLEPVTAGRAKSFWH